MASSGRVRVWPKKMARAVKIRGHSLMEIDNLVNDYYELSHEAPSDGSVLIRNPGNGGLRSGKLVPLFRFTDYFMVMMMLTM